MAGNLITTVQGSAAKPYEIRETDDPNVVWCSCPAWRNNKETPKTCKHIKSLGLNGASAAAQVRAAVAVATPARLTGATSKSPSKPMRLESVTPDDAQDLMQSDNWVAEQKVDGTRCVIHVSPQGVTFTASTGEELKHSASLIHVKRLTAALPPADVTYALDGELLWTGDFWAFDLIHLNGESILGDTLAMRRTQLESLFEVLNLQAPIRLLPQARTLEDKVKLLRTVHDGGGEGLVLKHVGKPYELGRRVSHQLKLKFTKTVDCVVTARNTRDHENAELACMGVDGRLIAIGSCSMIGKPNAQVGDVVEVKYLYASEDLRLYQPSLLKIRTDKPAADCLLTQLTPVSKEVLASL